MKLLLELLALHTENLLNEDLGNLKKIDKLLIDVFKQRGSQWNGKKKLLKLIIY